MKKFLLKSILGVVTTFALHAESLFFTPEMIQSHLKDYLPEEKVLIEKDLKVVRSVCIGEFSDELSIESRKPLYIATAGAPGARKTTILERFLENHFPAWQSSIVYVDPDQRGLKFMAHTYYSLSLNALKIADFEDYSLAVKKAYEKWRGASNYIALTLLEEAFAQKRDIAHGTTSTGEHLPSFLSKVKEAGYEVVLLLCSCEDAFRKKAVQYRNQEQKFYQSTPEDAVNKGIYFPQRMPVYFTHADTLYLYWSDDLSTKESLAGVLKEGKLQVIDAEAYQHFVQKFEKDRAQLLKQGKQIPAWNELLEIYHSRF